MRKGFSLILAAMLFGSASAQDTLITKEGDIKHVYNVEISNNAVFYKVEDSPNSAILRIDKTAVFMIKRKDGTKYDLGGNATGQTSTSKETTVTSQKRNEEIINQSNAYSPRYLGKKEGNAGLVYCILGYGNDSQIVNDDIEIISKTGFVYIPDDVKQDWNTIVKNNPFGSLRFVCEGRTYSNALQIQVKNKTNKTIYIDLGNTFFSRNGIAHAFYVPSSSTNTSSVGSGVGVNLGSVAGALGVGGVVGTLANGVNVGSGKGNSVSSTVYSQRVIAIPPMSIKELEPQVLFVEQQCDGFEISTNSISNTVKFAFKSDTTAKLVNGDTFDYSETSSPFHFGSIVSYSFKEDCSDLKNIGAVQIFGVCMRQD